ncbi:MAG: synthase gamma subunit [Solirubrobacterales bacterium]|jgi:F-type H+-transporting ATPase subunit gamma|nr:synthase gamma subunit [Solirubrobacterales bacterium]MEA2213343.1 F-type H+-transporting ATPase subunit gamma [Solirubrobacteraceae bacterium]
MATSQRDVRNRISSVKNIQKITRAMEMVAAARLRRAEQRIESLRPYADAIRRMTRQAAEAAGEIPRLPILVEHEQVSTVGLLVVAGDRGLAGAFNSNAVRAGVAAGREHSGDGHESVFFASGRRAASSLTFRGYEVADSFTGFTERPSYADARRIAERLMAAYIDEEVDQVEIFYNGYVSPLTQTMRRETLLPLQRASVLSDEDKDEDDGAKDGDDRNGGGDSNSGPRALVEYEPDPEEILRRLVPDYVEISIYRALLESSASELGARMTAMRNASENASNLIDDYTLEMNRARQAEITQEIMEVVAGAEGLS